MPTRNDWCLIIFLLAISCAPFWLGSQGSTATKTAYITVRGQLYRRLDLNSSLSPQEIRINSPLGSNTLQVTDGTIRIIRADCPDKICVHHPPIEQPGEVIACLPHELLIEIREE